MKRLLTLIPGGLLAILLAVGCNNANTPPAGNAAIEPAPATNSPTSKADAATTTQSVTKVPREALPIGDYMPPLDDDRVELARPNGWQALGRDSDYLVRFYKSNRNGLPRIEVTVEERTYGNLTTVTSENVEQFAKLVAEELGDLQLVEDVVPLNIGGTACARYVSLIKLNQGGGKQVNAERQRLLILNDGRLYKIDLQVVPNTVRQSRDGAYAICASLRFGGGTAPPPAADDRLPE